MLHCSKGDETERKKDKVMTHTTVDLIGGTGIVSSEYNCYLCDLVVRNQGHTETPRLDGQVGHGG